tara:strand:- start:736 stop:7836 length:7101 start_codon:yes stop_codon:yes gene_type:complete
MNQAQREYLNSVLNRNNDPSIYDEEDDLGQSSLNEAQKQLLIRLREQRNKQSNVSTEAPTGFLDTTYKTVRRGLSNIANLANVSRAEDFVELSTAAKAVEKEDARLEAAGEERPWWYKMLTWQYADRETPEELDALAAKYAQKAYDRAVYTEQNFPMTEAGKKQLQEIVEADTWFGQDGAIMKALSDPLATTSAMLQVAGEQIPTLAAVMLTAKKNPKTAMGIMGGSSYLQERYGQLLGEAQKAGYDLSDPNQALEAVKDTKFMADQADKGFTRGSIIAATDLAFLGLASRANFNLAGIGTQTGVQAIGGGTGEALAQVATGEELRPGEILVEGLAEGAMAPIDVAAFGARKITEKGPGNSETQISEVSTNLQQELANEEAQLQAAQAAENKDTEIIQQETDIDTGIKRLEAAKSFIPRDQFLKEREANRKTDALNPQTEIGQAYQNYKLTKGVYPANQKEENSELTKFMKDFVPKDDRDAGIQEYNAALDAHAQAVIDGTVIPVDNDAPKPKKTKTTTKTTPTTTETSVVETTEVKPPKPEGKVVAAQRAYAEEKLGKDWETVGGLSQAFENRTGFYKKDKNGRTAFQNKVDAEVMAKNEATTTPETTVDETTDQSVNALTVKEVPKVKGLSNDQKKIYDVLVDHFVGENKSNIDDVWAGGKFQTTKIAELAGVKSKQAVSTSINRFKTKILEQQGVIPKNATKAEKDAGIAKIANGLAEMAKAQRAATIEASRQTDELADTENVVDQRPDADEVTDDDIADNSIFQQQGMGTVASVGQGNYTGVSKEDRAWTKAKAEEKDEYADVRQERADIERRAAQTRMIQEYGQEAITEWRNTKSDGAVDVKNLSRNDLLEWISIVEENRVGDISDAQMQQEQREIERRYDADTTQNNTEGKTARAVKSSSGRNQTEQVGTQDNTETQSQEGDPDSFTAVNEQARPTVETKQKRKVKRSAKDAPKGKTTVENINNTIEQMFGRGEAFVEDDTGETRGYTKSSSIGRLSSQSILSFPVYPDSPYSVFKVHQNARTAYKQINRGLKKSEEFVSLKELETAQGVIDPDGVTTHLIADNIDVGTEQGVILHEVGVHLGLEKLLAPNQVSKLASAVNEWRDSPENSIERKIHDSTMARIVFARATGMHESDIDVETIAYAVEEAVNMGVEPDAKSKNLAQKWLSDIQAFFSDLVSRFTNKTKQITPAELVSLSHGAAAGVYHQAYTELGATSKDNTIVADYYAGSDRGVFMEEDANVTRGTGRGGEVFSWGKNSRIGEYTDIRTIAGFEIQENMDGTFVEGSPMEVQMDVYSGNMQEPLLTFEAFEIPESRQDTETDPFIPNLFALTIDAGGMGKKIKSIGAGFGQYKRLEGVNQRDVMRLLAEFRRRITRHRHGLVPNVVFDRVTGAAAERTTTGRQGGVNYKTLAKKFSMKRQDSGVSIQRAKGRTWVKSNLGDDAAQFYDGLAGLVTTPKEYLKFLYDFVHDASVKMPSAKTVYNALKSQEAIKNSLDQETEAIAVRAQKLKPERYALLNDFLGKSTFFQKWGYDPKEYNPDVFEGQEDVKIDPIMKIAFNRFNNAEKQIIADIFAHGARRLKEKRDFVKELGIVGNFFSASSVKGPYAPLKRFGRYVAVLKSDQLLNAEKALDANQTTENRKTLEKLKSDAKHYVVQFFDTRGAANRFAESNGSKYARTEAFKRDSRFDNDRAPSTAMLESLLGKLKADEKSNLDDSTKEAFRTMIREHYFESMDARDARTSGARRLNRAGYDKDMVRSFVFQARAEANLIATMKTAGEINEALATAKKEAAEDRGNLQETYNLLSEHYTQMMRRDDGIFNAIQDRIAAFNTVSMLTTNYAYHVQNATQVLIGINKLVGDFGGYPRAWYEMFKAYRIAHKAIKGGFFKQIATVGTMGVIDTNNNVEIDNTDGVMPKEYQPLVRELELHQLADVGIQEDLAQLNRFDTGFGLLNKATDKVSGITHRLYQVARYVEAHNRLSTAIAAFEMAKKNKSRLKALRIDNPLDYAITAVQHTQGAFNGLDAPLAIKKLPKLTTQYRKYQIMMAWNYGRAMKQAFAGETPEIKMIGWRTLGATLSHAAITTGIKGLPLLTPFAGLVMLWGADDDEEFAEKAKANNGYANYVEQTIRENIDDKDLANLLTRGLPAYLGLDFSGKIGHQNIFAFQPYSDLEFTRDGIASYLFDVFAGPSASTVRNFGAGVEAISKGQELKGFGLMIPKGARHYIDSFIYASDGFKASNNDVIIDPRNISLSELIMTATGMPPTELQNLKFTRGQQFKMLEYFTESSSRLKREYIEAHKERDKNKKSELRKEWRDLQKAKDRVRPFFNDSKNILTKSSVMELLKSTRAQKKRESKLQKRLGTN